VDEDAILADLALRSEAELIEIREQARSVVYGHMTTISALSQSGTFDREGAAVILRLVNQVLAGRRSPEDAGATDPLSLRGTLGHAVRFGGRCVIAP
jgi:hypothetical protein